MTEPKLLTQMDLQHFMNLEPGQQYDFLNERGLIAPEPVDPLHLAALELGAQCFELQGDEVTAREIRAGVYNHEVDDMTTLPGLALAALKRGMELASAASPLTRPRFPVPDGQTPLDDNLDHKYLEVIREGEAAFDNKAQSPYHGHSLECFLHATGWVQRDLRVALDKAQARIAQLERQP